jgi:hypothetical protein
VAPDDATTKPGDATTKPGDATRRPPGATTLQVRRDDGAGQRDGDPTRREEPARRCHTRSRHRVCATFSFVVMTKPKPTTPTDDDDNHFDGLAAALGKPDPELLAALLDGTIEADLVAKGRDIASSRVLTDMRRVYTLAHTFWSGAPAETRDKLRGFSPELLAIAVDQALVLEGMAAEHEMTGQDHDAGRAKRDAALREAFSRALAVTVMRCRCPLQCTLGRPGLYAQCSGSARRPSWQRRLRCGDTRPRAYASSCTGTSPFHRQTCGKSPTLSPTMSAHIAGLRST